MKKQHLIILVHALSLCLVSCEKSEFLEKKPRTDIVVANTLTDFNNLLENTSALNYTGGLAQMASDDYQIPLYNDWQNLSTNRQRNSYIWAKDLYAGEQPIVDWNSPYKSIFYANAVLDGLEESKEANTARANYLKGWALFVRAYAFYDLIRNFCVSYDRSSANTDLGIPLRLTSAIEHIEKRSTLQKSFDQVINDLLLAETFLPAERPSANLNRPSKIAVYALLARISLDMREYVTAENYADKSLMLYDKLIDYNGVSKTSTTPFSIKNDELIFRSLQVPTHFELTGNSVTSVAKISTDLIASYSPADLRLSLYFAHNANKNTYTIKRGYGGSGNYPFTGLATDELYLIKAECLARRNETTLAMEKLNQLLANRFPKTGPMVFVPLQAISPEDALEKVLMERRKELVFRGLRWHDLKRLNKEGAGISLTRMLNGINYQLPSNDPRWVFPIPDEEIMASGIQQNPR